MRISLAFHHGKKHLVLFTSKPWRVGSRSLAVGDRGLKTSFATRQRAVGEGQGRGRTDCRSEPFVDGS